MFGGVQAVTWTVVKQMHLIVLGLVAEVQLPVRRDESIHLLARHDRGAVPVHVVLRHGSAPEPPR